MSYVASLPQRGVVEVAGEDRVAFLQGLVSNDVTQAAPGAAVWSALLTPQGKFLAEFFVVPAADGTALLLECERAQAEELVRRLSRFRLRSKVTLRDVSGDWHAGAAWGGGFRIGAPPALPAGAIAYADPRLAEAGWRFLSREPAAANADAAAWDAHRIALGLPDGTRDIEPDKSVLLEAGFDELRGVSWSKGCYMGQELTARTKYRGLLKRRLVPVDIDGAAPLPGVPVTADGQEVGTMRSSAGTLGLATLRLDAMGRTLWAGEAMLRPRVPGWMAQLEEAAE